jgi:flavin reductase (DIM6/NTAB) family NADH-FMN oxidoreductase RutF
MNLEFVNALKNAASTVSVVTSNGDNGMAGATISSFCSVSANPAILLACIFKKTPLDNSIKFNKKFCINLLSEKQINISNIFAGREMPASKNKFDLVDWSAGKFNQPIISGSVASFECKVNKIIDGETHNIIVGNVISIIDDPGVEEALIYCKQKYAKYKSFDNNEIGLNRLMLEIL